MSYDNTATGLKSQLEREVTQSLTEEVELSDGNKFSQAKLVRRIALFESKTYPTGKIDSQGNYKFWYDIITPRVLDEVKNIDFDISNITIHSRRKIDNELPTIVANLMLEDYLRKTGQAEEINSAVEEGSAWGNILWKKVQGSYERCDLKRVFIINQAAENIDQTPVVEWHSFTQSDMRAKSGTWENVKEFMEACGQKTYKSEVGGVERDTTVPYYDVYERNGEVCLKDLKEAKGETCSRGDEDKYVFAKVIGGGTKTDMGGVKIEYILFAEEMKGKKNSKIYKEFHRGKYKGRWWREGLIELLLDNQVRANQIGNQIAQGLEIASQTWFKTTSRIVQQNILSDMKRGDIIRAENFDQIETRMNGFDQLIADWNRNIQHSRDIASSPEVVSGQTQPSGTPFRTTEKLDENAGKAHDFIREKLTIPFRELLEEEVIPGLVKNISAQEVLELTGDSEMLIRLMQLVVDDWYLRNLIPLGPHSPDQAIMFKQQKLQELQARPQFFMSSVRDAFKDFAKHAVVVITAENNMTARDLDSYGTFINYEQDPVRRSHMIEKAMKLKGLDVGDLPRSSPEQLSPLRPAATAEPAVQ